MVVAASLEVKVSAQGVSEAKASLSSMGESMSSASEGMKGMLKNALSFAAGQLVFNTVGTALGFLKDQIGGVMQESMDAAAELAQTNAVLKSTHDVSGMTTQSILDMAASFSHLTMFTDDQIQTGENLLLTFTNIGKDTFPMATEAMLNLSQAMGEDTTSAALQLGKALNDPLTGMTALQRVGVTFSQSQKDAIKAMMDTNNIAGAQGIILKELQREFGGSAEAAGKTFPGQLKILQQSMDDVKQKIGDALIPVLQQLTGWITSNVLPALDRFAGWFTGTALPAIQGFAGYIQSTVVPAFQKLATNANITIPVLAGLGAIILTVLVPAVWSLASGVIAATWPFLLIGAAVAGLVAIFMHFYQTNAGFKSFVDQVVAGLKQLWQVIQTNVIPAFQQAGAWIQANFLPIMGRIGAFMTTQVLPVLQQISNFLRAQFLPVWQQLAAEWQGTILPALKQLWGAIQPLLPTLLSLAQLVGVMVVGAFLGLAGIWTIVIMVAARVLGMIISIVGGIIQTFSGMVQIIIGIVNFFRDLMTGNFKKLGGDLGAIWQGIVTMFSGIWHIIIALFGNAFSNVIGSTIGWIGNMLGRLGGFAGQAIGKAGEIVNGIVNWFQQLPGRAGGAASGIVGAVMGVLNNLIGMAINAGASIVNGIADGIRSAIGAVAGAISDVAGFISSHLPHSPAKLGPLKDLAYQGSQIPAQIAEGMTKGLPSLHAGLTLMLAPLVPSSGMLAPGSSLAPSGVSTSGGGGTTIVVQSPPIYLDGRLLTSGLMPYMADGIRISLGVKF